jgi:lipopolysaccharide transport system permease protein
MSAPGHASSFASLARKRDLWWQFTVRAIEMRHRGSYLGMVWAVLTPLLTLGLYGVVFGGFLKSRFNVLPHETTTDFVLALFLGLTLFQLLAETLVVSPMVIVGSPNMVKKVVFPLEILPLSQLGAAWFHFLVSMALLLLGVEVLGRGLIWSGVLWLPVVLAPLFLLSAGLSWLCSALGVFFRDLAQVMPFLTQVVIYASAVPYPTSRITPGIWSFLKWNPFLHTVNLARSSLLWNKPVDLHQLGYTYVFGIAVFLLGRWVFLKLQPAFADVI